MLYRIEYKTFEDYCREEWGISRIQAHRLTVAAEIAEMLPTGNKPTSERAVRPLTKLETPEAQREAWQEAVEESGGKPTAKHVEAGNGCNCEHRSWHHFKTRKASSQFPSARRACAMSGIGQVRSAGGRQGNDYRRRGLR